MLTLTNSTEAHPRPMEALLPGVLAALAVLCAGTLLGGGLRTQRTQSVVQTALVQEETRLQTAQSSLMQPRTVTLLQEYVFAFADAAIRFDDVPKFELKTVTAIAMALPEGVDVVDMTFSGRDIFLNCRADSGAEVERFCDALQAGSQFQSVAAVPEGAAEDGRLRYIVACVFQVEEGQLKLPPAD